METVDFETFCADPQLLGEPISKAWVTFYRAVEGLPLNEEGEALFRQCTGRDRYVPQIYTECTGICGRRSEKTSTAIKYLLWKSQFAGWERQLSRSWFQKLGRHTRLLRVPIIAQDVRVSHDIKRSCEALILDSPVLQKEVADLRVSEITFNNGISFVVLPASKASVRGMTCPAALLDELAWVSIEGADDKELVRQVKPSMIQFGDARRLLKFSTPWQSSGVIYSEFSQRAERPDILVWQAATATMTPRIAAADLERERAADPTYFAREYLAEFTSDLESFIPATDIAAAIGNWRELPPASARSDAAEYVAALDASGLTGGDKFTFGLAHSDETSASVALLRGWRRAPVPQVCDEIASLCRAYGVRTIVADQYSFSFLAELLRQRDIELEQLAFTARSKPEIFFDLKNALAQGTFRVPEHPEALRELRALESMRLSGGAYRIGAPRGQHDDYVTVLALLAHKVKQAHERGEPWAEAWNESVLDDDGERGWFKIN
jgi:hypothetical protein